MKFTLRDFFQRYKLSIEQYGEILAAELLNGVKMGDAQPGYDIHTTLERMEQGGCPILDKIVTDPNDDVRVEVKSKAAETSGGKANVVKVGEVKMGGARGHPPMTHMLVVLVEPEDGDITEAWILDLVFVLGNRRSESKSQYLNVGDVRRAAMEGKDGVWEISGYFSEILERPISESPPQ